MGAFSHKINFSKVKVLASKQVKQLTYSDLNDVVKVVVNTPMNICYDNFETAVKEHIKIEKFILCFNEDIDSFKKKLEMKRTTLRSLASKDMRPSRLQLIN